MKTTNLFNIFAVSLLALTLSSQAQARCYSNCTSSSQSAPNRSQEVGYASPNQSTQAERSQSHDFDDVSNANAGWIHVGHTDTSFNGIGDQATIDNSINATFIFGDVN